MRPPFVRMFGGGPVERELHSWLARVAANSGTVSSQTREDVGTLLESIYVRGIRAKFTRLNLFCGDFAACMVPLIRDVGTNVETNDNFITGDYSERGANAGLKGNGSNKRIRWGVAFTGSANWHVSYYVTTAQAADERQMWFPTSQWGINMVSVASAYIYFWPGSEAGGQGLSVANGHAGFIGMSKGASGNKGYNRASASADLVPGSSQSAGEQYLFFGNGGGVANYQNARGGGYSWGASMSQTDMQNWRTIMNTFQTALGRNA